MQGIIHYSIHFGFPLLVALLFFKSSWKTAYMLMLCAFVIDLDHLVATPIFDPNRCSLNFHPLHSYLAIVLYLLLALFKKTRLIGLGLLIHILADTIDCILM